MPPFAAVAQPVAVPPPRPNPKPCRRLASSTPSKPSLPSPIFHLKSSAGWPVPDRRNGEAAGAHAARGAGARRPRAQGGARMTRSGRREREGCGTGTGGRPSPARPEHGQFSLHHSCGTAGLLSSEYPRCDRQRNEHNGDSGKNIGGYCAVLNRRRRHKVGPVLAFKNKHHQGHREPKNPCFWIGVIFQLRATPCPHSNADCHEQGENHPPFRVEAARPQMPENGDDTPPSKPQYDYNREITHAPVRSCSPSRSLQPLLSPSPCSCSGSFPTPYSLCSEGGS